MTFLGELYLTSIFVISLQVKNHPIKEQPRDSPGTAILLKPPTLEVCCLLSIELPIYFSAACNSSDNLFLLSSSVTYIGEFL